MFAVWLCAAASGLGCTFERKKPSEAAASGASKPAATPETAPPVSVPCVLDVAQPGPMRRSGRVKVKRAGPGLSVDTEVPALCGPLFNRDVDALRVKAGEGLLFEACVPEGYLQLTSRERAAGAQHLHHGEEQAGSMDVSFNRVGGATYSARALPTDRITLSDDFWKADVEATLRDVMEAGELRASLAFVCSAERAP